MQVGTHHYYLFLISINFSKKKRIFDPLIVYIQGGLARKADTSYTIITLRILCHFGGINAVLRLLIVGRKVAAIFYIEIKSFVNF